MLFLVSLQPFGPVFKEKLVFNAVPLKIILYSNVNMCYRSSYGTNLTVLVILTIYVSGGLLCKTNKNVERIKWECSIYAFILPLLFIFNKLFNGWCLLASKCIFYKTKYLIFGERCEL